MEKELHLLDAIKEKINERVTEIILSLESDERISDGVFAIIKEKLNNELKK